MEITHLAVSASTYLLGSVFWKSPSTAALVRLSGRGGAHPASCSIPLSSAPTQGLSHLILSDREGVASDAQNEAYPAAGSLPVSQLAARGTGFESRSNCVASCPPFFLRDSPVSGRSSFSVTHRDCVEGLLPMLPNEELPTGDFSPINILCLKQFCLFGFPPGPHPPALWSFICFKGGLLRRSCQSGCRSRPGFDSRDWLH